MDSHAEARMNRMAAENVAAIHWLTWPIRELVGVIKTAIFLVLFIAAVPTIFIGLMIHFIVTGQSLLDADAVLALKVIFTFVAPFAVTIVYRFAQALLLYAKGETARSYDVRRRFVFSMHKVFLITLGCNGRQRGAVWGYVYHIDESTVVARLESFVTEPEVAAQLRLNRLGRPVMQGHLYFNSNPLSRPQADDGILALGRPRPASAIQ